MSEVTNEDLAKKLKRIQISTDIQTTLMVLGFIGILSFAALLKKVNK